MTESCKAYEEALFEKDESTLSFLADHARACAACAEKRALWERVDRIAPSLRKAWDSPDLLPRIQEAAGRSPRAVPDEGSAPRPRSTWTAYLGIAAVVAVMSVATWISLRTPIPPQPGFGLPELPPQKLLTDESLAAVESSEKAYRDSIAVLERRAGPRLANADSPLLLNIREKLLVLDAAIAECRLEIEKNQLNTHLRRSLLAMYVEKRKTLQSLFPESEDRS